MYSSNNTWITIYNYRYKNILWPHYTPTLDPTQLHKLVIVNTGRVNIDHIIEPNGGNITTSTSTLSYTNTGIGIPIRL